MAAITKSAHERLQKKYDKLEAVLQGSEHSLKETRDALHEERKENVYLTAEIERFHGLLDELPFAPPREVREDGQVRVLSITARFILTKS